MAPRFDHGRTRRLAEGRAEPAGANADLLQGVDRPIEIRPHPARGPRKMVVVAISVGLHLVPPAADFADQLGMPGHLLAETEEGGG